MEGARLKSKDLYPAVFSRHAAAYERRIEQVMARGEAAGRERAIKLLEAKPGMRLLDLACGPGNLSRRLAALVAPEGEVVGVDLAPGMIERAQAAGIQGARFEVMDMEHLEFADSWFDGALCGHGLQFAPDLAQALGEAHRVLRPGARYSASVPVAAANQSVWAAIDSVIDRWLPPAPKAVDQDATRKTVGDALALEQAALKAGFVRAEVEKVDEVVRWESAEQIVAICTSWWECAARLERIDAKRRQQITNETLEAVRRRHPGPIETTGRNHVLLAFA